MSERMTSLDEWNDSDFVRDFQLAEDVILELQDRIAELEVDKAWLQEELRGLNKENLGLQANK